MNYAHVMECGGLLSAGENTLNIYALFIDIVASTSPTELFTICFLYSIAQPTPQTAWILSECSLNKNLSYDLTVQEEGNECLCLELILTLFSVQFHVINYLSSLTTPGDLNGVFMYMLKPLASNTSVTAARRRIFVS